MDAGTRPAAGPGTKPKADGTPIAVMPFESLRHINDTDMRALHLYLSSLPPRPAGH